jgi:hypothetical protein
MKNLEDSIRQSDPIGFVVGFFDLGKDFFQADELIGDNMYSYEKCEKYNIQNSEDIFFKMVIFFIRLRNEIKYCRVVELLELSFSFFIKSNIYKFCDLLLRIMNIRN